jgi:hypothetical protein
MKEYGMLHVENEVIYAVNIKDVNEPLWNLAWLTCKERKRAFFRGL